ncbi:RAMP superfamily CRISPR-associated protein [Prevotella falsenii]|uniref:RAMP superfamily CRISPR-associated protein n=1 Tax=Prevotella falsenii TaxID=515414 RepID=UPI000467F0A8|nr:RAMP superfamily CRISPR-associated protein [Prevotella falsenii]
MIDVEYKITFFSNWHCGSGLAAGADIDELVIKDKDKLPYVPGRTIKGLLREAATMLQQFSDVQDTTIKRLFGQGGDDDNFGCRSEASFTDATISKEERATIIDNKLEAHLYTSIASTAIDDAGIALDHSLRKVETSVPCTLYGKVMNVNEDDVEVLTCAFSWIKRLGLGRNRGFGRCKITKNN